MCINKLKKQIKGQKFMTVFNALYSYLMISNFFFKSSVPFL